LLPAWLLSAWLPLAALLLLLAGLLILAWRKPYVPFRFFLWGLARYLYWAQQRGRTNLPRRGGALLVCHDLHGLDFLLLLAATPRYLRFMVCTGLARRGLPRHVLRWIGAITLDGSAGPEDGERAIQQLRAALGRGELVCLFAQSVQSRQGLYLPFASTLERVVKDLPVPIVPVCLAQIWGSLYREQGDRLHWLWPYPIPYVAEVAFGSPLPTGSRPAEVSQALHQLSADAAVIRIARRKPVHRQFVRMAARRPFRSCLIDSTMKLELNYGKTLAGATCLARQLRPLLGDMPMIGIWLPPSIGGALANIAVALLGKTSVNLNYTSSAQVIQSALRQCGSRVVLTSKRFTHRVPLDAGPDVQIIYLEDVGARIGKWQRLRAFLGVLLLPGWLLEYGVLRLGRHTGRDLATVIFSSGSTGDPKGVMLSHANIAANAESMLLAVNINKTDRIMGVLPFFHSFGYTVTLWVPLQIGASTVYHADPRQAREIGELCRVRRCTIYLTTPTFLRFCVRKCEEKDFQSLRLLICGAEKLQQSLARLFQERLGVLPLEGYGCTELSPVVSTNIPDREVAGLRQLHNKAGTIGPPIPGVACRIVHPETRQTLPAGAEGLVLIYGANVMVGYLNRPDLTSQVLMDGWYVTGDMGHLDEDGYITLTGRLSRFAKVGGEMVPLEKVEEELHAVLQTSERVCVVTCVPDEARGERLVVLHQKLEVVEVRQWCQQLGSRGLPNLWLPSERDFILVPELPVLGSGKVNLQRVKEMALELARR